MCRRVFHSKVRCRLFRNHHPIQRDALQSVGEQLCDQCVIVLSKSLFLTKKDTYGCCNTLEENEDFAGKGKLSTASQVATVTRVFFLQQLCNDFLLPTSRYFLQVPGVLGSMLENTCFLLFCLQHLNTNTILSWAIAVPVFVMSSLACCKLVVSMFMLRFFTASVLVSADLIVQNFLKIFAPPPKLALRFCDCCAVFCFHCEVLFYSTAS